jgi:hypothetical protein
MQARESDQEKTFCLLYRNYLCLFHPQPATKHYFTKLNKQTMPQWANLTLGQASLDLQLGKTSLITKMV